MVELSDGTKSLSVRDTTFPKLFPDYPYPQHRRKKPISLCESGGMAISGITCQKAHNELYSAAKEVGLQQGKVCNLGWRSVHTQVKNQLPLINTLVDATIADLFLPP